MPIAGTDLVLYGSANMRESDSGSQGGAIDATVRVVPDSATLFNTLNDKVKIVSSNAGDNSQTVAITGRSASGSIVSETLNLNGTTVVSGTVTYERLLKVVISASHAGTVSIKVFTDLTVIAALETGVLTMRRPFYDVSADVTGGSSRDYFEKIFVKNNHGSLSLLGMQIKEQADPSGNITFAVEDAVDDNGTSTDRRTAPTGITGDGFSSSDKSIPGTDLASGSKIAVWLKLTLAAGTAAAKSTYTPRVTGSTV